MLVWLLLKLKKYTIKMTFEFIENKSDKLLIVFSTYGMGSRFMHYDSLTKSQKYNLLFLSDPEYTWYLQNDCGRKINSEIFDFVERFGSINSYCLGSSMGAYGALYHGLQLNCNVISSNPQINKEITLKQCNFVDIDKSFNTSDSVVYYLYGNYQMDVDNFQSFIKNQFKKVICENIPIDKHTYFLCDVNDIFERIDILDDFRKLTVSEGVKF